MSSYSKENEPNQMYHSALMPILTPTVLPVVRHKVKIVFVSGQTKLCDYWSRDRLGKSLKLFYGGQMTYVSEAMVDRIETQRVIEPPEEIGVIPNQDTTLTISQNILKILEQSNKALGEPLFISTDRVSPYHWRVWVSKTKSNIPDYVLDLMARGILGLLVRLHALYDVWHNGLMVSLYRADEDKELLTQKVSIMEGKAEYE